MDRTLRQALATLPARLLTTEVITLIVALAAILSGEIDTLPEATALGAAASGYMVSRGIAKTRETR